MRNSTRLVVLGRRFDTDAQNYIARVEAADGMALEESVKIAINNFVVGCKADGIWSAIKASCILAGARTLTGALVPLVGAAPTNFNFVSGDYNRKTGLVGNGSNKYLNSNTAHNTTPQNNVHLSVYSQNNTSSGNISFYAGVLGSGSATLIGGGGDNPNTWMAHDTNSSVFAFTDPTSVGFFAVSRSNSSNHQYRISSITTTVTRPASATPPNAARFFIFSRSENGTMVFPTTARLAFYSIGESLDLALLDTCVTALIDAYNTAIV